MVATKMTAASVQASSVLALVMMFASVLLDEEKQNEKIKEGISNPCWSTGG